MSNQIHQEKAQVIGNSQQVDDIENIISCYAVYKSFSDNHQNTVEVLKDINLDVPCGALLAIVGSSGSGKTTLLQLLGGLDSQSLGQIIIDGQNISQMDDKRLSQLRNKKLGFVYQFHHLLPELSTFENVYLPLSIGEVPHEEAELRVREILEEVGLSERHHHKPSQLSGGERQRVAIARAVVNRPSCLLADEPTGNLDTKNAEKIISFLISFNKKYNMSIVLNTHDLDLAQRMNRVLTLSQGHLKETVF